ncbi:CarD family transcriptional regulator [Bacillus sp. FJAT-27445]|uniref:CarD family transcriptional regulator n=1 Tax=Bacillus sp. FJAT-27445 TaxID=1679166 RepID=UPI0007434F72|nr:CarD family transcriptional regulator [Bacillus sp. FJAT-27445]
MFNIGDVIVYSVHGLSRIDDICEKTVSNVTRTYYVLRPLEQPNLTISTPIDNDRAMMMEMVGREEAEDILQSFKKPGIKWIEDAKQRMTKYQSMVNGGNRKEIAKIVNTLIRKNFELKRKNKKLYEQDRKMLTNIQNILFKELSMSLNISAEKIDKDITSMVMGQ